MLLNWVECNLVWNHTRGQARSTSSIWNHKYDFRPKLHDMKFNLYYSHFEIAEFRQYQYFIDLVAGLLKTGNKKVFYISFCIWNRHDEIYM